MFRSLLILLLLTSAPSAFSEQSQKENRSSYQRIVLLAPAAGDILIKLGAQDKVVGVTRSNEDFPQALKVGSHIKPNLELLQSLDPDLLIISSNRFFTETMSEQLNTDVIKYDPVTLDQILEQIRSLGSIVNRQQEADSLIEELELVRKQITPLADPPKVVFEVTESPYIVAGQRSIVNGIITTAGGTLLAPANRKIAKFNVESVLIENPDYYLYQVGPMNKRPTPPAERPNYSFLDSEIIKVNQLEFSRATTRSFYLALELNRRFQERDKGD